MKMRKSVQYLTRKHIVSIEDVREFLWDLLEKEQLNFHPDSTFDEYVNHTTNKRCYNNSEAKALDKTMEECLTVCNKERICIYEICIGHFYKYQNQRS